MSDIDKAMQKLAQLGLSVPPRPDFDTPGVPADITEVPDNDLMSLFAELTAWADYAFAQLAEAVLVERSALRKVDEAESRAVVGQAPGKGDRITLMKAQASLDPAVLLAKDEASAAMAYRKMVETIAQSYERDIALVSRELTRRTSGSVQRGSRWTA